MRRGSSDTFSLKLMFFMYEAIWVIQSFNILFGPINRTVEG
jgi:hypothetical protein